MKKLNYLLVCLLALPLTAAAQDFGVWEATHDTRGSMSHLERKLISALKNVFTPAPANLPWAKSVRNQRSRALPHGGLVGLKMDYILPQTNVRLTGETAPVVRARVAELQPLVDKHPVLQHFHFKILRQQDLADLPPAQLNFMEDFLMAPVTQGSHPKASPSSVQEYAHYMVRVTLQAPGESIPVHLLFNCYTQEIYVAYGKAELPGIVLEPLPRKMGQ